MPRLAALIALLAAPALAGGHQGGTATPEAIDAFVADWTARVPTASLVPEAAMEDAAATRDLVVERLSETLGPRVGYKAGLTSEAIQARFGVDRPVVGVLLEGMMLEDGASVPEAFGSRPLFEADLILVVGDAAINEATTREDVLASLSAVRPFIELPDLVVAEGEPLTGASLTAINVGARMGVMGAEVPADPALMDALGSMSVVVTGADGAELSRAQGASVLGHPLEAALFLVSEGVALATGDLISVGSIGPLMPPASAGGEATATYEGLPGDPTVTVRFE